MTNSAGSSLRPFQTRSYRSRIRLAFSANCGSDPTGMTPWLQCVSTQPPPQCCATHFGRDALRDHLAPDISHRKARQRQAQTVRKFTGQRLYLNYDVGGEKRANRPPRGCSSRPGSLSRQNRFLHLLTICRGISRREAIMSFRNPAAAIRTIFARTTSRYGDVYRRVLCSNSFRSSFESSIKNGLIFGMTGLPLRPSLTNYIELIQPIIRHRIYE